MENKGVLIGEFPPQKTVFLNISPSVLIEKPNIFISNII